MSSTWDLIVAGAGPAGLALAAHAARAGLRVRCQQGGSGAQWPHHYGLWSPDAEEAGLAGCLAHRWEHPVLRASAERERTLATPYALLDNVRAMAHYTHLLTTSGGDLHTGAVQSVESGDLTRVILDSGEALLTRLFIDATGSGRFLTHSPAHAPGWQTAWGYTVPRHADDRTPMRLMDFTPVAGAPAPTFAYILPLGTDRIFVEETVLVATPEIPPEALRGALGQRLEDLGLAGRAVVAEEICRIPMGGALPPRPQPLVGWGAAAGMVHPASGYSLGHVLRWAPAAGDALAALLARDLDAAQRSAGAWEIVWPADRVKVWHLYHFGMQILQELTAPQLGVWFDTFFEEDEAEAMRFLQFRLQFTEMTAFMWRFWLRAPAWIQWRLTRSGFQAPAWRTARAVWSARASGPGTA